MTPDRETWPGNAVPDGDYGVVWTLHLDTALPDLGYGRVARRATIRAGDAVTVIDRSQQLLLRLT